MDRFIDYINYDYVDHVNTDSIVEVAISRILKDLDPHSVYISTQNREEVKEDLEGDFIGIGIQFFKETDTIAVVRTLSESPSKLAGIKPGDRIVEADGIPLVGKEMDLDSLKNILRGKNGSTVQVKVKRPGEKDLLDFDLTRNHIPLKSISAAFMLSEDLGYIKIDKFSKTTYQEFKTSLHRLKDKGATKIAIDLRGNGGGYLKEAIKIADEFLEEGKLIVLTKDNKNEIKKTYATKEGDFEDAKVYVLIDQNSASASEVVAGALQDNDIGTIVGRRSFGKGLVQREMELGDGSAMRLTVARYYTPTGRSIQKPYKGETPQAYYHDFMDRYKNGELVSEDSIHVNDSLRYVTPKGKVVFGGGGIIPDVFVPKDVSYKKESLDYMLLGGILDQFIFQYMDKNRPYYNGLTQEEFEKENPVNEEMVRDFSDYLKIYKLNFRTQTYKETLKTYLKASMAKQLFGTEKYQEILSQEDAIIEKVLSLEKEAPQL